MQSMAPRAQALLDRPTQQYQGELVAPFSAESEAGLQGLAQYAGQGMPGMRQGYNVLGRAMQGIDPGMMAMLRGAYGGGNPMAGNISAGMVNPNISAGMVNPNINAPQVMQQFNAGMVNPNINAPQVSQQFNPGQTTAGLDLIGRGGAMNAAFGDVQGGRTQASELRGIASGVNPYLDPTFDRAANRLQNRVASVMSQAGMSGSGAQQDLLQQGLGDLATQIYGGAYEADQARRMGAASQLAGLEQSDLGRGLQAAGMRADIFGQDRNAAMQAGQTMAGLQQADFGRGLQAQGMGADLASSNAARDMQAQGMNVDIQAQNLARMMQAQGMSADLANANAARMMQAQGMSADIAGANAGRGLQAQGMNADIGAANAGRGLQAQGMNADLFTQNLARQLQAGGMLSDASRARNAQGLQAVGMLPGMYQAGQLPYQDMLRVGSARDTQAQNLLNAQRQQFEQGQLLPWQDLARYQAMINPLGQQFVTNNSQGTSTTTQRDSPLQQVLGAAMVASTLFGNPLGAMGAGAMGAAAPAIANVARYGAGLSGLGGLNTSGLGFDRRYALGGS